MNRPAAVSSAPCNGNLVSQLRGKLGWTQEELAGRAGYSDRLIRKAESGQVVSASTVATLAATFREQGLDVDVTDLLTDPATIARRFIEAMYTEKAKVIDSLLDYIDEQVVFQFAGDPAIFPFAGKHVGINAARNAFALFYSVIQTPEDMSELNSFQYLSTGLGALVWGDSWAHPIGMPMEEPVHLAIRMDFRRGKLILFDDRFDTAMGQEHFMRAKQTK